MTRLLHTLVYTGALIVAFHTASAQSLKVTAKRDGPTPKATATSRKIHYEITVENTGKEKFKDLLLRWTMVVDETDKSGGLKFHDGIKIISLFPGDSTNFNTEAITVSNKNKAPRLKGYAIKVHSGNTVVFSKVDPPYLTKEVEAHDQERAADEAKAAEEKKAREAEKKKADEEKKKQAAEAKKDAGKKK